MLTINLYKSIAWEGAVATLNWRLKIWYVCLKMGVFNEMGQGLRCEKEPPFPQNKIRE